MRQLARRLVVRYPSVKTTRIQAEEDDGFEADDVECLPQWAGQDGLPVY